MTLCSSVPPPNTAKGPGPPSLVTVNRSSEILATKSHTWWFSRAGLASTGAALWLTEWVTTCVHSTQRASVVGDKPFLLPILSDQGPTGHVRSRAILGTARKVCLCSAMGPGGSCTARPGSNSEQRGGAEASGLPWAEVAF